MNINPAYRTSELEFGLNQVGVKALITVPSFKSSDYLSMLKALMPEMQGAKPGVLKAAKIPDLRWVIVLGDDPVAGSIGFADVLAGATKATRDRVAALSSQLQFDDPINIQITSGTTGRPKAATLTHHNIVNNALFTGLHMRLTDKDRMCIPVSMYHCFGMVLGTLCCAANGATMMFASAGFDAVVAITVVEAEKCTVFHGVPAKVIVALDSPSVDKRDLSSLRRGVIAGAPCPAELMKRIMDAIHMTAIDDPVEWRVETVGRALPHTGIKKCRS